MLYRTYSEMMNELKRLLPNMDIVLGTTKKSIERETLFIVHSGSTLVDADDGQMIGSSTYSLIFLLKRAAFTNARVIEMTNDGVTFSAYDDETRYNAYSANITLYGPASIPVE